MWEISNLYAGMIGGGVAALVTILSFYHYMVTKTEQYLNARHLMKTHVEIMGMEHEITMMKKEIRDIYKEFYKQHDNN